MRAADTTEKPDPWALLRSGNYEDGLALLREAFTEIAPPSHIMELGVAYLWTGDYPSASTHFENAIRNYPQSMSSFYGMAGAAQWCVGKYPAAVERWSAGLGAQYADAAGLGVRLPLLLFVASILAPDAFPMSKAEDVLAEKAKDIRANHWPGALSRLVLNRKLSQGNETLIPAVKESEKNHRDWLIQFYRCTLDYSAGNLSPSQFTGFMRSLTDTSQPSFSDQRYFLSLIWREEFFIARVNAQSDTPP